MVYTQFSVVLTSIGSSEDFFNYSNRLVALYQKLKKGTSRKLKTAAKRPLQILVQYVMIDELTFDCSYNCEYFDFSNWPHLQPQIMKNVILRNIYNLSEEIITDSCSLCSSLYINRLSVLCTNVNNNKDFLDLVTGGTLIIKSSSNKLIGKN